MSYILARPVRRRVAPRGFRGLGFDYDDLLGASGIEQCDPRDTGCVLRNQEKSTAAVDLWMTYMKDPNTANLPTPQVNFTTDTSPAAVAAFLNNQPVTSQSVSVGGQTFTDASLERAQQGGPASAVGISGGQLSFTTSRGGTTLYPGDTWVIRIAGASPNQQVTVKGGQGGAQSVAVMGTTDGSGNFSKSGTITADQVGAWSEAWSVGSALSGSFTFTVQGAPATTPSGAVIINSSGPPAGSGVPASVSSLVSGLDLPAVPVWGWLALGGVLLFAFGGKK